MSQSSAGDFMDMAVGRQWDDSGPIVTAKGWFDIKKQDGATGEITDFSGPNSIQLKGLHAMLKGFSAGTGTGLTATTKAVMLFSDDASVAITPGETLSVGNAEANLTAGTGTVAIGSGTSQTFAFTGSATIFSDNAPTDSGSSNSVLASKAIQVVAGDACTINMIQIIDDNSGTDTVIAARSNNAAASASDGMSAITLANTDTLTVTYTITVTAS